MRKTHEDAMMIRTPIPQQQKLHLVYDQSPCEELYDHLPPYRWKCPTLAEFIRQLERGFGDGIDPSGLNLTGFNATSFYLRAWCGLCASSSECRPRTSESERESKDDYEGKSLG